MTHQEFIDNYLKNKQYHIKDGVLYVGGGLNLGGTKITELPEGLSVGGWLNLENTEITELPEGLSVGGWLDLQGSKIRKLPEGLSVGGWLGLRGSNITKLPEGLSVGGEIFSDKKLIMTDRTQINLIHKNKEHFDIIKNPTKKAISMHKLLWRI